MIVSNLNIIMFTNRQHIDFFKLFKILDLKKIQKQGDVKLIQDKTLSRKVLSIQGNVSTQNYIVFDSTDIIKKQPMLSFAQRYLYLISWMDLGKAFTFQLILNLNGKIYKALYSSVFKSEKLISNSIVQIPLELKSGKWTIIVVDLYDVCEKFGNSQQIRLSFHLRGVEVRAHSKLKNLYLSDNLYDPSSMPKDMELPLRSGQDFFTKYSYLVVSCGKQEGQDLNTKKQDHQKSGEKKRVAELPQKQKIQKQKSSLQKTTQLVSKQNMANHQLKTRINLKDKKISQVPISAQQIPYFQDDLQQNESFNMHQAPPKPRATIDAKLAAFEGKTIFSQGVIGLEGFITYPSLFAVHKPLKCMSLHKENPFRLAVGYIDGSICIWDLVRQKSIVYLKTQLNDLKQIMVSGQDEEEKIFLVGKDKMKRENILIINQQQVLFKQISTFSIEGFIVCQRKNNEEIIVSYGYQNIRLWKMNENNHIITGSSLYLGKMNQKISYKSACLLNKSIVLVGDSSGFLTKVSLDNEKMEQMRKVSENGIDIVLHIPEIKGILVSQTSGCIKILSYDLQLLQEFDLGNRIKNCSVSLLNKQVVLFIQHYNSSISSFNIETSQYSFLSRQHTQQITMLKYHSKMCKIVSISKDNTIRVWSLAGCDRKKNAMEYQIKQEYEFLISNGQQICSLAVDGKSYSYIGFSDATIRKINIDKYEIIDQKSFAFQTTLSGSRVFVQSIEISKNSKNLLFSFLQKEKGKGKNGYVILSDQSLNIIYKFNPPFEYCQNQSMTVLAGFSQSHKKFFICWSFSSVNRLQIYSLTGDVSKIEGQLYLQSVPASIRMVNQIVYVSTRSMQKSKKINFHQIYSEINGELIQVHQIESTSFCTSFPLLVYENGKDQIQIEIMNGGVKQTIDMPEKVENIEISQFFGQNEGRGFILCSGTQSNAIYMIQYEARNVDFSGLTLATPKRQGKTESMKNNELEVRQGDQSQEELQCIQSKLIAFSEEVQKKENQQKMGLNKKTSLMQIRQEYETDEKINKFQRQAPKIISLYADQEQLFQRCQNYICPPSNSQALQFQNLKTNNLSMQEGNKGVELMYGWNQSYSAFNKQFSHLIWQPSSQTALFLSNRTLILHYFTSPIHQKIVRLPAHPNNILMIGQKYVGVLLGNQIKIYSKHLEYVKTLTSIGQTINTACLSTCQGYLIILSSSQKKMKSYIQISDFVTQSILCSTYLELLTRPQIVVNPYQQYLQFILVSSNRVYFYRVTSILTLQTQQLQKLDDILNSTDVGNIASVKFIHLQEEQILLIGMQNGSIIIVDSRSNSILMLCKNVCGHQIEAIQYEHHGQNVIIVFVTQSNIIFKYSLQFDSLQSLISALNNKPDELMTVDSQITICSGLKHVNGNTLGMLLMTKFGVLWLLDVVENDTIKVLTVHVKNRDQAEINVINKALCFGQQQNMRIITASGDGSVKETCINTLQQTIQIFKPRRKAHDVIIANGLVIVSFGMEICFYKIQVGQKLKSVVGNSQQWTFLGSVNLLQYHVESQKGVLKYKENLKIIGVRNIPFSDNYIVCTSEKLFMLYHQKVLSFQTNKLKMQIKQICGGFDFAESLDILGYNYVMVRESEKINIWIRKQKRGQNPIEQLSKIEQVAYYMMDVNQVTAKDSRFIMNLREKNRKQYILCLAKSPIIQWRDFEQHCIIKEVQIGVSIPKTLKIDRNGNFLIGDQQGIVWSIKQNGLTLNKIRVFDSSIQGIQEIGNGKILAYGPTLAIVNM